ncbi:ROK family transcriptional regulator [Pontibacter anaerobius]|uniref:ROK family transcriptional regulator n=1 Tax=Pontibacter anaerobius TaxID=2993940 RepID=A0ABT3RFK6_9BACT|nr:ROK family transcriptional regulator [Pontibacter anaerobius]MCX2740382.1 ROK family transcriptional regulator [Pontibacter anaerobius]
MSTLTLHTDHLETLNNVEKKKFLQKVKIIRHLYVKGARTNADICSRFNISSPTSMGLLGELISEGLVEKQGLGKSVGGRKPDLYGLRNSSLFVLSIDMDRFSTRMAIMDNNNNQVTPVQTYSYTLPEDLSGLDTLCGWVKDLISASGIDQQRLVGIGVSMPGLVASKEGDSRTYLRTDVLEESLQEVLSHKLGKPVFIQNDVKSAALAELRFGQAKGRQDVLVISIDWGVGTGVIMDGRLRGGSLGFAGEFGHIPLIENGTLCHCGKRGCLETMASGVALARMAREGIKAGQKSLLSRLTPEELEQLEPQHIIDAAHQGDQFAINLLSETGVNLGKGIAILIQLFNPELVILGGKIAEAGQLITTPIQQSINTYCMAQLRESTSMALSTLGLQASMMGATATVLENILEQQLEQAR